jgi:hypothetical protein
MKACLIFNNAHAMDFILHCKPCMHACIQGNEGIILPKLTSFPGFLSLLSPMLKNQEETSM